MTKTSAAPPRVLIVAGSDPVAGAGMQADLKTVTALGGYAMTALTAVTVQDTRGVTAVHPLPPALVAAQMTACLLDVGADAVKIGMLATPEIVAAVAQVLDAHPGPWVVLDPVLAATAGGALLTDEGMALLRRRLLPRVAVLTPNLGECARLSGRDPADEEGWIAAATLLAGEVGGGMVLLKGGHGGGPKAIDLLCDRQGVVRRFERPRRLPPPHGWHGTGCVLAAALATGLARGEAVTAAVARALDYVQDAMTAGLALGRGQQLLGQPPPR